MASALRFNAKDPAQRHPFAPDSQRKHDDSSANLREAVAKHAQSAYMKLEQLRGVRNSAAEPVPLDRNRKNGSEENERV